MKSRRLIVTLEIETAVPLIELRDPAAWAALWIACGNAGSDFKKLIKVHQVQANVIRSTKTTKRRARKKA